MRNTINRPWLRFIEGAGDGPVSADDGAQPATPPADAGGGETDWKAEAERWKQHSRTWEDRAKANSEARKRLDEIEDSNKSELEKLQEQLKAEAERVAEFEQKATLAEKARVRADIASEFGISKEDRELFLTADDEDTLRKQAEKLSKRGGPENPNQGQGKGGNNAASAKSWADSLLGRQ